jgi:hypothetical protein
MRPGVGVLRAGSLLVAAPGAVTRARGSVAWVARAFYEQGVGPVVSLA